MKDDVQDEWAAEEFENTVAAALIACYETKIKRNKGAAPADRLTEERVALFRKVGPYIPSPSRVAYVHNEEKEEGYFDVENDPLPYAGCVANAAEPGSEKEKAGIYLAVSLIRRSVALGKYWVKLGPGVIYEILTMDATNTGIVGERRYVTVSKQGIVKSCTQRVPNNRGYQPGAPVTILSPEREWTTDTAAIGSYTLQSIADRRFCWSITAQEQYAKAHLGCMKEEIKSLLYARSLPMTATGRKRPILHLVEAHRRRMRNGTDVDVTAFLRGTQTVEIGGTLFSVRAPAALAAELSAPSVRRYYGPASNRERQPIKV